MTLTALGEAQFLREVYDVTFSGGRRENREMDQNHPKSTDWKFLQILGTCIYIYIDWHFLWVAAIFGTITKAS